jgi:hypothetical protein
LIFFFPSAVGNKGQLPLFQNQTGGSPLPVLSSSTSRPPPSLQDKSLSLISPVLTRPAKEKEASFSSFFYFPTAARSSLHFPSQLIILSPCPAPAPTAPFPSSFFTQNHPSISSFLPTQDSPSPPLSYSDLHSSTGHRSTTATN